MPSYLNAVALCGMNGFMIACKKGFARIVSLIMKYVSERAIEFEPEITSAFVNAKHQKNGQSALTLAVLEGHLEVVKILTEENEFFKVDFNAKDGDRLATPFMYACQSGFKEIVSHLLKLVETRKKKIFDLHVRDKNQNTAFHYACSDKFEDQTERRSASMSSRTVSKMPFKYLMKNLHWNERDYCK